MGNLDHMILEKIAIYNRLYLYLRDTLGQEQGLPWNYNMITHFSHYFLPSLYFLKGKKTKIMTFIPFG